VTVIKILESTALLSLLKKLCQSQTFSLTSIQRTRHFSTLKITLKSLLNSPACLMDLSASFPKTINSACMMKLIQKSFD